jgi:hypothetical protein
MPSFPFPPYGEFPTRYNDLINPAALAPPAWRPNSTDRETTWGAWRDATLVIINQKLWPQWDSAQCDWISPDLPAMHALTNCDFDLLAQIQQSGLLNQKPATPVSAASIPSHKEFFVDEDTAKIGTRYFFYDTTLPGEQLQFFLNGPTNFGDILRQKCGSASIQFKQKIQRPRAYQVAKLMGRAHRWENATTSLTASMSSGHCFEGCLLGAGIYERWLQTGFAPTAAQLEALEQYTVDIGDRRVFAGVHYPSDNLASWIISLRLVSEVCPDARVGQFLARAVGSKSAVFKIIKSSECAAYEPALSVLHSFGLDT